MLGILIAPIVALGIGVWAEFADLSPPLLLAVALPAMTVCLISLTIAFDLRPIALVVVGAAIGFATFAIAEGLYLAIHYARGGTLDFESLDSQSAMAAAGNSRHPPISASRSMWRRLDRPTLRMPQ